MTLQTLAARQRTKTSHTPGIPNLCLAGGVALNCVANGKVLRDSRFDDIWIQPAAGGAGGALGTASIDTTAEALAAGEAVGWFQGRMEFGPRPLGNRSILTETSARPPCKRRSTSKAKHRESFRRPSRMSTIPPASRPSIAKPPSLPRAAGGLQSQTGCPVIENTSFNVRGEPIVCTPADALRCFLGTDIDCLAIGNCFLRKAEQDPALKREYVGSFELD